MKPGHEMKAIAAMEKDTSLNDSEEEAVAIDMSIYEEEIVEDEQSSPDPNAAISKGKDPEEGVPLVDDSSELPEERNKDECSPSSFGIEESSILHDSSMSQTSRLSRKNVQRTSQACLSSVVVLIVRLFLDDRPTAYVIHSIIVFFDMVLIHIFTKNLWLSISGEVVTVIFFLAFHFTKEKVYELLETTLIAVLCSFHLIASRNKHMKRKEELEIGMSVLLHSTKELELILGDAEQGERINYEDQQEMSCDNGALPSPSKHSHSSWLNQEFRRRANRLGGNFYEHFLDGSAGVMYTSFLGLIIDELIQYGKDK